MRLENQRCDPYARARHARYFEVGVVYHFISRTRGNLFLFNPDADGLLREIMVGVLAEAHRTYENIANFATSLLSNHHHVLAAATAGDPRVLADYIGFIKRELSRRWKREIGWSGSMWEGYLATALVTSPAQVRALKYTLSQTTKEGLVSSPDEWPGFHCAPSLVSGEPMRGFWFDGTRYGKARYAENRKKKPSRVLPQDYKEPRAFAFDKLPALEHLSDDDYRAITAGYVEEIVAEARATRGGAKPLGAEAICAGSRRQSSPVPLPEWFDDRKRMIVWDDVHAPEVEEYLERYWSYQISFRVAARQWRDEQPRAPFPPRSFVPGLRPRPIAHMEQGMA